MIEGMKGKGITKKRRKRKMTVIAPSSCSSSCSYLEISCHVDGNPYEGVSKSFGTGRLE
jgi:hypothetical protein